MTRVIALLTLLFVLSSSRGVVAQDPPTPATPTPPTPAPATPAPPPPAPATTPPPTTTPANPLDPVVVTATKTETPVGQTGSSVSVITREQIEQRQAMDVLQMLREVPGVSLIQSGSRGGTTNIFVRGGNSNMNLMLIDGMKVNQGGGAFDFANITSVGVGRIEMVRGPQSALYGADAMTSVIQLFTPRGEGPFSAWASLVGGNYSTYEALLGASWGNRQVGVFVEYGHAYTGGILDVNSSYRNDTVAARLDVSPIPELDVTLTARYIASRVGIPTEGAGDRFEMLDPHQSQEDERFVGTVGVKYRQTPWLEHRVMFGANLTGSVFRDQLDDIPTDAFVAPEGNKTTSHENRILVDYNVALTPPKVWDTTAVVVVGGTYEYQNFTQRLHPVGDPNRTNDFRDTKSAYGQIQLGWRDSIFLTAGGRYDDSTAYGTELTPRVSGAAVIPVILTRVHGAWGTGIKEPSFFEEFGGFGIPGNPDIQAEKSWSWEAGVSQPIFNVVEIGATYFENRFRDMLAFVSFTEGSTNIPAAKTSGVEAVVVLRPIKGWTATGTYTYLMTEVTDDGGLVGQNTFVKGEPLLRRPRHSGSVSVGYTGNRVSAVASLYVKGQSIDRDFSSPDARRVTLPGYDKLDLSFAVILFKNVIGLKEITWKTRMQNLINEQYEEVFGFSSARISAVTGFEVRY
jgi:vitamin B12 transporter